MKDNKIIYSLNEEDIQTVSLDLLERNLTSEEIKKVIPFIEKKINWYDAIADSINENIESKVELQKLNLKDISLFVEQNIGTFHQKRIQSLDTLKLSDVLRRKNPYLFKAKYVLTAEQIIRGIVDAHISSSEEGIFGDWLEGLAIFINGKTFKGRKSGITGIDLEFDKDGVRYIITIKSGPNWGNSSQVAKMVSDFKTAKKTLRTSNSKLNITAVNGCCYGRDNKPDKGDYYKYCGQKFWEFISGDKELYTEIIEPLGHKAKEKNDDFMKSYSQMINKFTKEFANEYCDNNGNIAWKKLVEFNSSAK